MVNGRLSRPVEELLRSVLLALAIGLASCSQQQPDTRAVGEQHTGEGCARTASCSDSSACCCSATKNCCKIELYFSRLSSQTHILFIYNFVMWGRVIASKKMNQRNKSVDVLDEKIIDHSPSIVAETTREDRFAASNFAALSVDELWRIHVELEAILSAKMTAEVRELGRRIDRLNALNDTNARDSKSSKSAARRPYPAVLPKYRNLSSPFQTWAGRGRQPRWLSAQLDLGKRLEDFRIAST
jgi:DNA-binding protein H-NS